jgi:intraflagellar transport protein 46
MSALSASDVAVLEQVHYKKPMPDIEQLMDVWPEEFEDALTKVSEPMSRLS